MYTLSKEDLIVTKIGRYSEKDKEDIELLIRGAALEVIFELIENVKQREDLSSKIKEYFIENVEYFRRDFNV